MTPFLIAIGVLLAVTLLSFLLSAFLGPLLDP